MSPRQSTISLHAKLSEELNSESPWTDEVIPHAFHDDAFHTFDSSSTTLGTFQIFPTDYPLPSFEDDHLGPPSTSSGGSERVDFTDPALNTWATPYGAQYNDLFDDAYRATYYELFHPDYNSCTPFPTATSFEHPQPALEDSQPIIQTPPTVGASIVSTYPPYFDYSLEFPQTPPTPGNMNITSLPTSSSSSSSPSSPFRGSPRPETGGDADRTPPSGDDEEHHPAPAIPSKKSKKGKTVSRPRSSRRKCSSSTSSSRSGSEASASSSRATRRSHPYPRINASHNFQRVDGSEHINKGSAFHCTVVGCEYKQKNHHVRELRRHIKTHDRWMKPDEWSCCGVGIDVAHLYGVAIEEGMSEEEFIEAGAYVFRGQLMIGGCMKTFSRRDGLKRHVDNPNIKCVGDMSSY